MEVDQGDIGAGGGAGGFREGKANTSTSTFNLYSKTFSRSNRTYQFQSRNLSYFCWRRWNKWFTHLAEKVVLDANSIFSSITSAGGGGGGRETMIQVTKPYRRKWWFRWRRGFYPSASKCRWRFW